MSRGESPTGPTGGAPGRRGWIALTIALFVSVVLVVGAFNPSPHTGGDNAAYVTLAYSLVNGGYTDLYDPAQLPHTKYPPVFPALLAVLVAMGARTWTALKLVPAAATVAAVGFTYLWAERRLGALAALGVSVALAMSSAVVYYSHWIISDPVFVAFTMAALWLLDRCEGERVDADGAVDGGAKQRGRAVPGTGTLSATLGVVAVCLAYFTRSAGLPLLVALLAWLGLRRRWKSLGVSAVALGLPVLLWWLRGRGEGVGDYGAEFWMVDPYQPELGTVGVSGLGERALTNLVGYVTNFGPGGIVGQGRAIPFLGIALTGLALFGWYRAVRERVGPAELFLPLYAGLILLWPEVWSGDRFALPLYPLFFVYAVVALREVGQRLPEVGRSALTAVVLLVVMVPAGRNWLNEARLATQCSAATRAGGAWACYPPQIRDFAQAAAWIGQAAPEGTAVMSRKPRMFYALSGVPSRVFPFTDDPAVHLAEADGVGARLILLDRWDGLAGRYVGGAVGRWPQAFCSVRSFGEEAPSYLLAVRPPAARGNAAPSAGGEVRLEGCAPGLVDDVPLDAGYSSSTSMRIPLLERLDP